MVFSSTRRLWGDDAACRLLRADIFVINLWAEFNMVRGIHAGFVGVAHEESWRQEVRVS